MDMTKRARLTADAVVLKDKKVLLIKRIYDPYNNYWALPGGLHDYGEEIEKTCLRELKEEACINGKIEKLVGVYSNPKRDPRGQVVTIAYLVSWKSGEPNAGDEVKEFKWFSTDKLPKLAFDHAKIIKDALQND